MNERKMQAHAVHVLDSWHYLVPECVEGMEGQGTIADDSKMLLHNLTGGDTSSGDETEAAKESFAVLGACSEWARVVGWVLRVLLRRDVGRPSHLLGLSIVGRSATALWTDIGTCSTSPWSAVFVFGVFSVPWPPGQSDWLTVDLVVIPSAATRFCVQLGGPACA
jgi:hypothetical protein